MYHIPPLQNLNIECSTGGDLHQAALERERFWRTFYHGGRDNSYQYSITRLCSVGLWNALDLKKLLLGSNEERTPLLPQEFKTHTDPSPARFTAADRRVPNSNLDTSEQTAAIISISTGTSTSTSSRPLPIVTWKGRQDWASHQPVELKQQ